MANAPRFEDAPGIVVRERAIGNFSAWWQCRTDIAKKGFKPRVVPLWVGVDPSDVDRARVSDICNSMQGQMLVFGHDGIPETASYDGTIRTLIACYKGDKDSPFQKLRYRSRLSYSYHLKYIQEDHGEKRLADIRIREILGWYQDWVSARSVPMAHGLITQLRALLSFGGALLECPDCSALRTKLATQRFTNVKPRTSILTAEMAEAVRAEAHRQGRPSIALAQAIQFEAMLRQRDVIGEWIPLKEPGVSDVQYKGMKWLRGMRWEEIDASLVLRHLTSKRQKEVEIRLADAPMVVAELANIERKASGPVIINESTGRPYSVTQFRQHWRKIATDAGVPKNVRNQDSRAGAITEATEAGASLDYIKHAAAHSQIQITERYSRSSATKTAEVLQMRVRHRTKTP